MVVLSGLLSMVVGIVSVVVELVKVVEFRQPAVSRIISSFLRGRFFG